MTDLRIADAPELTAAEVNDSLKVPTGGYGNYSITMITIRDWLLNYKMFATQSYVDTGVGVVTTALNAHTSRVDNPHQVTKAQVGLGNVDNTSDINKPISSATQTALTNLNTSLTSAISVKANSADVYIKSEVYTKTESDNKYHQKLSIDGILAPTAVFDDVKNIDGVNGTPDLIINQPIQNLTNRTEFLKTHNNLSGRSSENSHPSEAISYGNITQKKYNDGVESIAELLAIQNPFDGMRVYVNGLQQGWFIYDSARSSENDGGLVFDGWVREYVLFATPSMFGIAVNDSTNSYGTQSNALFNCGFPILLGKGKYYSDAPIIINNKNLSLQGVSKLESRIVFKNSGHGIVQNTTTSTHVFSIHDCSITTSQNGTGNGSGFKYDASAYIATLSITGTGYKVLGNRTLNRGQISNVDFGSSDDSESSKGWKHALEFLGAMNFSVNGLHMRLPTDRSGNGCWIHGDGMLTDIHFNDVYSFWGDKVFRMNDYVEGFHLTNFELVNCNDGIFNEADADTTVSAPVKMLSSYIGLGHILGYRNCISSTWMSSAKLTGLELYVWSDNTLHPVSQGINVLTCDGVLITGSTIVNANPAANGTTIGVQLGTGWGNTVSECLFKGESWYAGVALGTNNSFYNNTIRGITVDKSQNAILVNETNCSENTIESPSIVTSTGQSISTSANVLSKNNVIFRKSLFNANYAHTANTTFTIDISSSGFTQVPISIEVSEVAGVFGGIQYSYRRDVSTSTQITIETTALIDTPSTSNRALFVNVFGV